MGSLDRGTMCVYCDRYEAGYIPDGCCGPACGPCLDYWLAGDNLQLIRFRRWIQAYIASLTSFKSPPGSIAETVFYDTDLSLRIAGFSIHA